jgi:hypothetical protein
MPHGYPCIGGAGVDGEDIHACPNVQANAGTRAGRAGDIYAQARQIKFVWLAGTPVFSSGPSRAICAICA